MALKLLTKLAAKSKIAKAGIVVSKTKTGVLASTAAAKLGTTAIATTSTAKAGLIAGAAVATSAALGTETSGDNGIATNFDSNTIVLTVLLTVIALFVVLIIGGIRRTKKRRAKILQDHQDYRAKVLQDYHEATNTITYYQETSPEEKTKLIKIIQLYLIQFADRNVFDAENTVIFIGYIQRDCIKLSQAFLLVDRFMDESQQSVYKSTVNLKTLMEKLDAAEKNYNKGSLSYVNFRQKVGNIIFGLDHDEDSLINKRLKLARKFATKIALSSVGLDLDLFSIILEEL